MAAKSDAELFWKRGAQGVVHRGGEGNEERHVPEGYHNASAVEEGVLITSGLTEDRAKARLKRHFSDLVEGEAFGEGRQVFHVQIRFWRGILHKLLQLSSDDDCYNYRVIIMLFAQARAGG